MKTELKKYTKGYILTHSNDNEQYYINLEDKSLTLVIKTTHTQTYNKKVPQSYTEITYFKDGKEHKDNEPAYIYYTDKEITTQKWYINGINYNPNGASTIKTSKYIRSEMYNNELGQYHKCDGPAVKSYLDGKLDFVAYYLNGKQYKEKQFNSMVDKIKNNGKLVLKNKCKQDLQTINILAKFYNNEKLINKTEQLLNSL